MNLETLRERWTGPRWRWWALLAGVALTGVCLLLGWLLGVAFGADAPSLMLLCLMLALVVVALVGAGLLERLSSRMIVGQGLERQPLPDDAQPRLSGAPRVVIAKTAEQERRDRTTIRAGLMELPLLVAFFVLLFK
jgi:membrane glycosyltransferase